jgi:hypothetical protein
MGYCTSWGSKTCAGGAKDGKTVKFWFTVKCALVVVRYLQKLDNDRFEAANAATSGYHEAVRGAGQWWDILSKVRLLARF